MACLKIGRFILERLKVTPVKSAPVKSVSSKLAPWKVTLVKPANLKLVFLSVAFLKSAKVFGEDIPLVQKKLRQSKGAKFKINEEQDYLEFQVHKIKELKGMDIEVGISSFIMHPNEDGLELKELKVDLCYPDQFDFAVDG